MDPRGHFGPPGARALAPLLGWVAVVLLAACASVGSAPAARSPSPGPTPSLSPVVGPAASPSASPVLAAVIGAWETMTWTRYAHHDVVEPAAGRYQFDCVGMTNYFLSVAAPGANDALRSALKVEPALVPTPAHVASFFASLPAAGTAAWLPVRRVSAIAAGDVIAIPPASPGEAGHAAVAAGPPLRLADGGYAMLVYDSTSTPHGPGDTRAWDPHNAPGPNGRPSGLGSGTIELLASSAGVPEHMLWSVGGSRYGAPVQIARPR
jgi:hypothetical protein